ncbi:Mitochondrial import inner membrane translocase subunit TIM44 [Halotydeus destructor]|nr:Mitochondrial import inner membrane translocase subunit TIM44 [Halotydeus destructor]
MNNLILRGPVRPFRLVANFKTVKCINPLISCQRCMASQPERKGIIGGFIDNIKSEMKKNKELKENLAKFREEAQKLEESDALKKAREKFQTIEAETSKGGQQIKEQFGSMKEKFSKTIEDAQNTEIGQKTKQTAEGFAKQARSAAESIAKQGEQLGNTEAVKAIGKGVRAVQEGVDIGIGVYRPPEKLRMRVDRSAMSDEKPVEANTEATGIELHKESKWSQSWQNFKDNNQYVNKVFDWKTKYDESENPAVRVTRAITDKVSDIFGGMFQKTELSEVLTEIIKLDPGFDKQTFLREVETEIIPNVLEAMVRGELEILKDWCSEAVYSILSQPMKTAVNLGYVFDSKILDVENVELVMGKMMDQGPVLIITFQAQQIMVVRDKSGKVVEGDPDAIQRVHYVWALCRDPTELDPKAAWRILEMVANSSKQFV